MSVSTYTDVAEYQAYSPPSRDLRRALGLLSQNKTTGGDESAGSNSVQAYIPPAMVKRYSWRLLRVIAGLSFGMAAQSVYGFLSYLPRSNKSTLILPFSQEVQANSTTDLISLVRDSNPFPDLIIEAVGDVYINLIVANEGTGKDLSISVLWEQVSDYGLAPATSLR